MEVDWETFEPTHDRFVEKGTFGSIYTCHGYAVKIPNMTYSFPEYVKREIEIWKDLDHPNIIKYITHFLCSDMFQKIPCIVMEYAPQGDLFQYIGTKGIVMFKIFTQLASALMYLHDRDIVHLDCKLENILVMDDQETIKLCDFGNAIHLCNIPPLVHPGSAEYAAPEWAAGSRVHISKAMDVWSFGVILYIFITEQYPVFPDPCMTAVPALFVPLLQKIFQIDPAKRPTIKECYEFFRIEKERSVIV